MDNGLPESTTVPCLVQQILGARWQLLNTEERTAAWLMNGLVLVLVQPRDRSSRAANKGVEKAMYLE